MRIRKITPLKVWHLIEFEDIDFYKESMFCSETNLFKWGGNSIVVIVIY